MPTLKRLDQSYVFNQSQKILPTLKSQKNIEFSANSKSRAGPYNDNTRSQDERVPSNDTSERSAITIKDQTGRHSKITAANDERNSFVLSWNAVDPPSFRPQQGLPSKGTTMPVGAQVKRLLQNKSTAALERTRNPHVTTAFENPYNSASTKMYPVKKYTSSTSTSK